MITKIIVIYITYLLLLLKRHTIANKSNFIEEIYLSKTWKILNKLILKNHDKSNSHTVNINNIQTEYKLNISNAFCSYFTDIVKQCPGSICPSSKQFNEYFIGNCHNSLFLHPIDKRDIITIINELKRKNSRGHDGISSKLVKYPNNEIAFPLSIMINTSIESGHVPDAMTLAKVVPIWLRPTKSGPVA